MAEAEAGGGATGFRGPPPGPPPPVVPVASVEAARASAAEATDGLEATMVRAASFSDEELHRRVNNEWCTVDSLRHVVLIIDLWLSKAVLGEQDPFHPIALPPTFMPPKLPGTSIDPDARPTFDEACEVVRGRLATVRTSIDKLTPDDLERAIGGHAKTVGGAVVCALRRADGAQPLHQPRPRHHRGLSVELAQIRHLSRSAERASHETSLPTRPGRFVSTGTRFDANDWKATKRPVASIKGQWLRSFAWAPSLAAKPRTPRINHQPSRTRIYASYDCQMTSDGPQSDHSASRRCTGRGVSRPSSGTCSETGRPVGRHRHRSLLRA